MTAVYGKPGCKMCDKAKEKLSRLKIPFKFVDVSLDAMVADGAWRENGGADFLVEKTWREDTPAGNPELPLLLIDGKWYNYPEAMAALRARPGEER